MITCSPFFIRAFYKRTPGSRAIGIAKNPQFAAGRNDMAMSNVISEKQISRMQTQAL